MTGTGLRGSSSLRVQPTQYSRQCLERPRKQDGNSQRYLSKTRGPTIFKCPRHRFRFEVLLMDRRQGSRSSNWAFPARDEMDTVAKEAFLDGVAKARANDLQAAITSFTEAVEREPGWAQARLNRGVAWFLAKNFPAALSDFDLVIASDPNSVDAYLNRSAARRDRRYRRCGCRHRQGGRTRPPIIRWWPTPAASCASAPVTRPGPPSISLARWN